MAFSLIISATIAFASDNIAYKLILLCTLIIFDNVKEYSVLYSLRLTSEKKAEKNSELCSTHPLNITVGSYYLIKVHVRRIKGRVFIVNWLLPDKDFSRNSAEKDNVEIARYKSKFV